MKNNSSSIVLTATDRKLKKKLILHTITMPKYQCDAGISISTYYLNKFKKCFYIYSLHNKQ